MAILVKPPVADPPYSLHDAYISEMRMEGDTLRLVTQYGYVCTTAPYGQVEGDVEITGIDWDFSCVYVMEYQGVLCGNYGTFTGRKLTVEEDETRLDEMLKKGGKTCKKVEPDCEIQL